MLFFALTDIPVGRQDTLYESLISRIAKGDKDALSALYENTKSAVYGFALSIVQNTQDAEDVLQDTYVSIYASAGNYKHLGKPMAWIFTIVRNSALMKIRVKSKTANMSEEEWNLYTDNKQRGTEEDRIVLNAALREITGEESQIVMLHAVAGFKHREIAGLLELPLSTVLSKYSRAIKKLKSILEEGDVRGQ